MRARLSPGVIWEDLRRHSGEVEESQVPLDRRIRGFKAGGLKPGIRPLRSETLRNPSDRNG